MKRRPLTSLALRALTFGDVRDDGAPDLLPSSGETDGGNGAVYTFHSF